MVGIQLVLLVAYNIEVVARIDAALAVNMDNSSQIGILGMLLDSGTVNVSVFHYSSTQSKDTKYSRGIRSQTTNTLHK